MEVMGLHGCWLLDLVGSNLYLLVVWQLYYRHIDSSHSNTYHIMHNQESQLTHTSQQHMVNQTIQHSITDFELQKAQLHQPNTTQPCNPLSQSFITPQSIKPSKPVQLMFTLSPKQDLILLAIKHNHPHHSWQQISELILTNYNCMIPSDICCERYEMFLKKIIIKEQSRQYRDMTKLGLRTVKEEKIPENFIFAYRELKEDDDHSQDLISLKCLQNYERRLLRRLLGLEKIDRTRTITKTTPRKYSQKHPQTHARTHTRKQQQQQQQTQHNEEMIDELLGVIKLHTEGVLTQQIIQQKIQQLMFEIIEALNEKIMQVENQKEETIANGLQLIRLMKRYALLDKRRRVFEIYYRDALANQHNYRELKGIFKQIELNYCYKVIQPMLIPPTCIQVCQQFLQIIPHLDIPTAIDDNDDQVKHEEPDTTTHLPTYTQPQPQPMRQPQPMQQPAIQPQQQQTKPLGKQILTNFQITIVNSNTQVVSTPNQPEQQVKIEVKVEQVKVEAEPEPVKCPVACPKPKGKSKGKAGKPPITGGKVWLIIDD